MRSVALSADGRLVAWCADASLQIWKVNPAQVVAHQRIGRTHFYSVRFHPSGTFLASAKGDGKIDIWDAELGVHSSSLDWGVGRLYDVAFDLHGDRAACCGQRGEIVVWDIDR